MQFGSLEPIFISVVLIGCSIIIISFAGKAHEKNKAILKRELSLLLEPHLPTLLRRRDIVLARDTYGLVTDRQQKAWREEQVHFAENAVYPKLSPAARRGGAVQVWDLLPLFEVALDEFARTRPPESEPSFSGPHKGVSYEVYCADLMKRAGWSVRLTKGSGDQGADLVATRGERKLVVQCKYYGKPVGNKAVQEVLAAQKFEGGTEAAVVSQAGYTKAARELAVVSQVHLLHHGDLEAI